MAEAVGIVSAVTRDMFYGLRMTVLPYVAHMIPRALFDMALECSYSSYLMRSKNEVSVLRREIH